VDDASGVQEIKAPGFAVVVAVQNIINECETKGGSVEVAGYEDMVVHVAKD
jgi:hypothetical protein